MIDGTRFEGDDTLGAYRGEMKDFIIDLQLNLRHLIVSRDAFPKSNEFEKGIKFMWDGKAEDALRMKSEAILFSVSECGHLLISTRIQRKASPYPGHHDSCECLYHGSFTKGSDIVIADA